MRWKLLLALGKFKFCFSYLPGILVFSNIFDLPSWESMDVGPSDMHASDMEGCLYTYYLRKPG